MVALQQIRRVGRALFTGGIVMALGAFVVRYLSGSVTDGGYAMEVTSTLFIWAGGISAAIGLVTVLYARIRMRSLSTPEPSSRFRSPPHSAQRRR